MRLSNYEMILPLIGADEKEIDDRALLVNGLYGAFDIVPKRCADFLIKGKFSQVDSSVGGKTAVNFMRYAFTTDLPTRKYRLKVPR